jgi:hypothetical protein
MALPTGSSLKSDFLREAAKAKARAYNYKYNGRPLGLQKKVSRTQPLR